MIATAHAAGRLPQVLLILGSAGIGRQRFALWVAQRLQCTTPGPIEPCGSCRGCRQVLELMHPDVHWFVPVPRPKAAEHERQADEVAETLGELMAERRLSGHWVPTDGMCSHGMGSVRLLQRRAALTASAGGARVFVLGDAERLIVQESSQEAPNALLKLLEEPPAGMTLVLTAVDAGRLLPTVVSRAVPVRLRPLAPTQLEQAAAALRLEPPPAALRDAMRLAAGAPGRLVQRFAAPATKSKSKAGPDSFNAAQAADRLLAASRGREARAVAALTAGVSEARGKFTQTLDALADTLAEAAREVTGAGARRPLPPLLSDVNDPARVLKALDAVQRARQSAQGNVNPQLLTAVLADDLTEALWR